MPVLQGRKGTMRGLWGRFFRHDGIEASPLLYLAFVMAQAMDMLSTHVAFRTGGFIEKGFLAPILSPGHELLGNVLKGALALGVIVVTRWKPNDLIVQIMIVVALLGPLLNLYHLAQ